MKRLVTTLLLVLALAGSPVAAGTSVDAADEYEIKAAMYLNLLRLVEWPPGNHGDAAAPLVVGVSGSEEMARAIETVARSGSATAGRKITVKRISGTSGVEECHSVFIGGADRKRIEGTLMATSKDSVLTVGESDRFVSLGGMIALRLTDERIQIEVNLDAARGAGLNISSQLLKIAVVKTGSGKTDSGKTGGGK